jgi:hypothetical protein
MDYLELEGDVGLSVAGWAGVAGAGLLGKYRGPRWPHAFTSMQITHADASVRSREETAFTITILGLTTGLGV